MPSAGHGRIAEQGSSSRPRKIDMLSTSPRSDTPRRDGQTGSPFFSSAGLRLGWALLPLLFSGCSGCSQGEVTVQLPDHVIAFKNLKLAWAQAQEAKGEPPENMEDLKPYFEKMEIPDPEAMLKGQDGEPLVLRWGKSYRGQAVIAHEKVGVGGEKWAVVGRQLRHLNEEDLQKAIRDGDNPPPPAPPPANE